MQPLKYTYDALADDCLELLNKISAREEIDPSMGHKLEHGDNTCKVDSRRDTYALLRDNASSDEKLRELWRQVTTIPDWVDWAQLARGQDVFYRYGGAVLTGLAYQSLVGGMAAGRLVETLARTGGFSPSASRRRLFETTQHILQCTRSIESLHIGGEGHVASVRVRLLHAAVRRRVLALAAQRPDYYDVERFGIPINDLDSIATVCSFSASLIWSSLPRQGIIVTSAEAADYIALWRYIGYLVGAPAHADHFGSPERARAMFESLLLHEMQPTATSKLLANNVIDSLADQPPVYPTRNMLAASARWLNGNALGDALDLPKPGLYCWLLVAGQCAFFASWAYLQRLCRPLDRWKIAMLRQTFFTMVVDSKHGLGGQVSMFEFQHIPQLELHIGTKDSAIAAPRLGGQRRNRSTLERRNLLTLSALSVILTICIWIAAVALRSIVASLFRVASLTWK